MKKFKLKDFIKVFLFVMVGQVIVILTEILSSLAEVDLSSVTSVLLVICSFPMSLINTNLPFYVSDNLVMIGIYWIVNVLIQAVFVYLVLVVIKKMISTK